MRASALLIAFCLPAFTGSALAQAPARVAFEVASVKENRSGEAVGRLRVQNGGRFDAVNISAEALIATAYGSGDAPLRGYQMSGAPDWTKSARFDVQGMPPASLGVIPLRAPQMRDMLQSLLAERFKLSVHHENRDVPVYALTLARADGQLGSHLRSVDVDCLALLAASRAAGGATSDVPICTMKTTAGSWSGHGVSIGQLTDLFSNETTVLVRDHTGLRGNFDFDLTFRPDSGTPQTGRSPAGIESDGPSIFTAVQEQLGLKLESRRESIDVLVIDHIEHPTED